MKKKTKTNKNDQVDDGMVLENPQHKDHYACWCGRWVSLYIFHAHKWLKVGVFCNRCGAVALYKKYNKKDNS
ncbi:MAG TPA: hypothetical protein VF399_11995 [bacterium]